MIKHRIKKLYQIAREHGIENPSIRSLGGEIYANINGVSFKVRGYSSFNEMCISLKNYKQPEKIDITEKIEKIERATINSFFPE